MSGRISDAWAASKAQLGIWILENQNRLSNYLEYRVIQK